MLKALVLQLGRASSSNTAAAGALEGPAALRVATALPTLSAWRAYSSGDAPSSSSGPEGGSEGAAISSSSGSPRPSRLQTKEWRSWIDTKLNSTLETGSTEEPVAATAAPAASVTEADEHAAASAAAMPASPPPKRGQPRAKGFELEQQIYRIISPTRPVEDATLPEGVSNYGQLAMASDAPRFERAAANIADISPQRVHPSRLFFPNQIYSPVELDPYKSSEMAHDFDKSLLPSINPDEVTRLADYKNAPLLAAFLSEAGKMPLRQCTQLRAKLHRHLARQVKIARMMGILSPTERWQPQTQEGQQQQRGNHGGNKWPWRQPPPPQ